MVEPVTNAPRNLSRSFPALLTRQNVARNDRTVHCSCEVVSISPLIQARIYVSSGQCLHTVRVPV